VAEPGIIYGGAGQSNMYRIVYCKISIYIKREGGSVLIIYGNIKMSHLQLKNVTITTIND
jgi:hypothetical protein